MKLLRVIVLFLVCAFLLCGCSSSSKGVEVTKDEFEGTYEAFIAESNYKVEYKYIAKNTTNGREVYHSNYTATRVDLRCDKTFDDTRTNIDGTDKYTILDHVFGHFNENNFYADDDANDFSYIDKTGDYVFDEPKGSITDERYFGLKLVGIMPTNMMILPKYESVTFDSSKGCYIDSDNYEYYFNKNHKLFKIYRKNSTYMGGSNVDFIFEINVTYGGQSLEPAPAGLTNVTYD